MSFPITANLDRDLRVEIHLHSFHLGDRERQCWTFLTQGLAAMAGEGTVQKEMSLSLLVEDDSDPQDFPKTPVKMFELLGERIASGQLVDYGDATRLGQKGIFGFPCLFYVPSIQYGSLPALDDRLALVLVHQAEYDYARQYGFTRFLSRLGRFCSSFPYPTWNTQARPSMFDPGARELSMLADASHVLAERSHVHLLDGTLQFQLHSRDAEQVSEALASLSSGQIAILNTAFSSRCDASLYWQEGQADPGAFAAPEFRTGMIGGSFIALGPGDIADAAITEDGFTVNLKAQDWKKLRQGIQHLESIEIQLDEAHRFILDVIRSDIRPVARPYFPRAAWRKVEPLVLSPAPEPLPESTVLQADPFVNLSGENSLAQRVRRDSLNEYISAITGLLAEAMSEEQASFSFDLELGISPSRVDIRVTSNHELNPDFVMFVKETVSSLKSCSVSSPVRISIPYRVNCQRTKDDHNTR